MHNKGVSFWIVLALLTGRFISTLEVTNAIKAWEQSWDLFIDDKVEI